MNSRFRSNEGFTLIEVLIVFAILAFISMGISKAITQTFDLRGVLTGQGDFYTEIRLTLGVLEKDFSQIYSPAVMIPPKNQKKKTTTPNGVDDPSFAPIPEPQEEIINIPSNSKFWGDLLDNSGIRAPRFTGTENRIQFISPSHTRIYKEAKESTFAKITYEFEEEAKERDPDRGKGRLIKKEDPDVFDIDKDDSKFQKTYPLLSGIRKIKFRYYKKEKDQWFDSWDSTSQDFKNQYPDAIEVQLMVSASKRLNFEGTYRIRTETLLNGIPATL